LNCFFDGQLSLALIDHT